MAWPAVAVVFLDQTSKLVVTHTLKRYDSVPVIPGFFDLVHIRNRGMVFGLMNRPDPGIATHLLAWASVVAVALMLGWFFTQKQASARLTIGFSLVLGGAVGNLIDRFRLHEVIDFLDFYVGSTHWPAFNVADAAITVGTFVIALCLFMHRDE